jgi:hypothetical protein
MLVGVAASTISAQPVVARACLAGIAISVVSACGRVWFDPLSSSVPDDAITDGTDGTIPDGDGSTMCELPCGLTDQGVGSDGCTGLKVLTLETMTATTQGAYSTGDTSLLGPNTFSTCGGMGSPDAFYGFTLAAQSTIDILVRPASTYDPLVHLDGGPGQGCPGSTLLMCSNNGGLGVDETIHVENVQPGTYYITVDGTFDGTASAGPYQLLVQVTTP